MDQYVLPARLGYSVTFQRSTKKRKILVPDRLSPCFWVRNAIDEADVLEKGSPQEDVQGGGGKNGHVKKSMRKRPDSIAV
jgi:hypothetical protein